MSTIRQQYDNLLYKRKEIDDKINILKGTRRINNIIYIDYPELGKINKEIDDLIMQYNTLTRQINKLESELYKSKYKKVNSNLQNNTDRNLEIQIKIKNRIPKYKIRIEYGLSIREFNKIIKEFKNSI